jgi:phage recombination protein Bet
MNNVVALNSTNAGFTAAQITLIRNTVAKDCNTDEFNLFVTVARNAGLDPFRKQISAIVFNKDKADKRQMAIITGIDGLRAIAARSNRYRPDEDEAVITYDPDLKGPTNPLGIVKAVVRIFIADMRTGEWRPVAGVAYWDEFAPIKDEWAWSDEKGKRLPTGRQTLDGSWPKMGRVMISKCAEAQAIRKAFPEDTSALYEQAEMDRAVISDLTPSEIVEAAGVEQRMLRIGGSNGILFQFWPNDPLVSVGLGQIADRIVAAARDMISVKQLDWFESINSQALREFWARAQSDALEVKKFLESRRAELKAAERGAEGAA